MNLSIPKSSIAFIGVALAFAFVPGFYGQALAAPSVSASVSKNTVALGSGKRIFVTVKGVPAADISNYSYKVDVAPFPYNSWKVEKNFSALPATQFSVNVKPRINSKFRIVIQKDSTTAASKPLLLYVEGQSFSAVKHGGPGVTTIRGLWTFDSSIAPRFNSLPAKQRKIYVYKAKSESGASRPTTKYRIFKTIPMRMQVRGNVATIRVNKTFRGISSHPYPSYWIYFCYVYKLPGTLPNLDEGYGKPNTKVFKKALRTCGKKTLTYKQTQS